MCQFFSFCSNGKGKYYYCTNKDRKKMRKGTLTDKFNNIISEPDSHTSIATFLNTDEDKLNKYEYNFLTKKFKVDQINAKKDDREEAERWVKRLDAKEIVRELVVHDIVHPFKLPKAVVGKEEILLLKKWDSVRGSVGDSVDGSVWPLGVPFGLPLGVPFGDSLWGSIRGSVWDSVEDSVWGSVRGSVWGSVRGSVWDSVRDSVEDSVWAYYSSFFKLKKSQWKYCNFEFKGNPFQSAIDLWNKGLVPSFDGTTWRLHSGKKAEVVFKGNKGNF